MLWVFSASASVNLGRMSVNGLALNRLLAVADLTVKTNISNRAAWDFRSACKNYKTEPYDCMCYTI